MSMRNKNNETRSMKKKILFIISVYTFATAVISFGYYQSRWGKKIVCIKKLFSLSLFSYGVYVAETFSFCGYSQR
jgi:hypothetical protein